MREILEALTFDDVLLQPSYSEILPHQADLRTNLTQRIKLNIPLISAAMDTVTESRLAISMAQQGSIGVIHKNMSIRDQVEHVMKVKKHHNVMVMNPIVITPEKSLLEARDLMQSQKISSIPVISKIRKKLVGIITNRDIRFLTDLNVMVKDVMTRKGLITVEEGVCLEEAKSLLYKHRIEKLLVVNKYKQCVGLLTVNDIERIGLYPNICKDDQGRLRVAAAIGTESDDIERAKLLDESGVDALIIDTAHGHSLKVLNQINALKKLNISCDIIAGNVATAKATRDLIDAGVNAVKVGIGPGSICTTRIIAGVGVPQLTALLETCEEAKKYNIPIIADGGIRFSGDIAKAIATGASCVMVGSLLAGTKESPGEEFMYHGRMYKSYRGMGSEGAMVQGSAERYGHKKDNTKFVPEGVEGRVLSKGSVKDVIHQLMGGLRAAMGYTGNSTIQKMQTCCVFRRITHAGLRESHVHDIKITRESPNYSSEV